MSSLLFFFLLFSSLNVTFIAARELKSTKENPSSHLKRNIKISNNLPESHFLHSKASSPLKADIANFANYKLATAQNNDQLPSLFPPSMFNGYGPYEDYFKNDINFINYSSNSEIKIKNNNQSLEPGRFFRESNLKKGTVMPMPDITNKLPESTFLPRNTVNKIPFSSTELSAMKEIFNASDNSAMERIIKDALKDCERKPNQGETKRCVASSEDMIDFATSVLGRNVALRKTKSNKGSKQNILIRSVKRINGGKVTKAVSCHQKLYPYLLYYCHSVPDVAVYEADILDPKTKKKINHGVAICHLDTSSWSVGHEAFHALGSGPGQIEVCHWIFEKDLIWTNVDH
ncbi:hypothetical protein Dsin_010354 [Dipteronia sinensis]|uniref:BURP domain-containing protein n=1 Tax=Dipteronia sinensis TaxID=43782 RepID=A0AAE0ECR9_9ROSI|nr:hypothetical protein Dsin_010354 [Dipteronia sinensis]